MNRASPTNDLTLTDRAVSDHNLTAGLHNEPIVLRGIASTWPAVKKWNLKWLRSLAPELQVQLIVGNREQGQTLINDSTWGEYCDFLSEENKCRNLPSYNLKEFDLLAQFPELAKDLNVNTLFPRKAIVSNQIWLGPESARTGLHYDYLDNIATNIMGKKRFYLAAPGTIEALGAVAKKYDRWAKISSLTFDQVVAQSNNPDIRVIDLDVGDAIFVPRHWWHEVVNLKTSLLLSGFFGERSFVWKKWLTTEISYTAHKLGWRHRHGCTCHSHL